MSDWLKAHLTAVGMSALLTGLIAFAFLGAVGALAHRLDGAGALPAARRAAVVRMARTAALSLPPASADGGSVRISSAGDRAARDRRRTRHHRRVGSSPDAMGAGTTATAGPAAQVSALGLSLPLGSVPSGSTSSTISVDVAGIDVEVTLPDDLIGAVTCTLLTC